MLRRAIEEFACTVLVCGMKVKTTEENRTRLDAKFPKYGLDLPPDRCVHLQGLSWALEMEILARATACLGHPSGFTEALEIRRGGGVLLLDPPLHYLAKLTRHHMPFFGARKLKELPYLWAQPHSEERILRRLGRLIRSQSGPLRGHTEP